MHLSQFQNSSTRELTLVFSMGKSHQYSHTVSRFFPSRFGSCRYSTNISDVIENSIIPITTKSIPPIKPISSSFPTHPPIKKKPQKCSAISKTGTKIHSTGLKGRRCPAPIKPISPSKSSSNKKYYDVSTRFTITKNSSSSNSGWFSSEGGEEKEVEADIDAESDEFFSFSSDSSSREISRASWGRGRSRGSQTRTCPPEVSPVSVDDTSSICRGGGKFEANYRQEIGSFKPKSRRRSRGKSRGSEKGSCTFEESAIAADNRSSSGKMKSKSRQKTSREAGKCSRRIVRGSCSLRFKYSVFLNLSFLIFYLFLGSNVFSIKMLSDNKSKN